MDYRKYLNILTEENEKRKNEFLNNKIFKQNGDSIYHTSCFTYKGLEFNFVISNTNSSKYGTEFNGFIVEVQSKNDDFKSLEESKTMINKDIGNDLVIVWLGKDKSQNGNQWNIHAKLEANIEDESKWDEYVEWQIDTMIKFLKVFPQYTIGLKKEVKLNKEISIYDKLFNTFKNESNQIFTREQIIDKVINNYPNSNRTSIIPSDYCVNLKNKGSSKYELFEHVENTKYKVLNLVGVEKMNIKNIILYGAPGVGKTHNYKKLISLIEKGELKEKDIFKEIETSNEKYELEDFNDDLDSRVEFVTFHQSFGYEDFIEGFRPNENGYIQLENGIFKNISLKAKNNLDKNFYLVIDEINRGNISKIIGELITLIEESKRDNYEVTLPYSKEKFSVPSNFFIIGTMNTTDKSIALIDVALRRRFTFIKMQPNSNLVIKSFKETFEKLNEQIKTDLGEEYQIGHSYFMNIEESDLDFIKDYKIKPLLEEYYYGENDKLKEVLRGIGLEE